MTGMETTTKRIYGVYHGGSGRGWFVMSAPATDRYDARTESGPYTTHAQAEAKAEALRVMADPHTPEPEASKHSYRVRPWVR